MRCLECGAEIAERAQVCARCGSWAPVEYQLYVAQDRADAADEAAGLTPAAIPTGVGQQRPESAPDPDVDGAMLAEWAGAPAFSATRLRPGYDIDQVDTFLRAIRDTFLGIREPSLTSDEIRTQQFSITRLRPGYDMEEVDAFLDEAESRLAAQVSASREIPASEPGPVATDPAACGSDSLIAPLAGDASHAAPSQQARPGYSRRKVLVMAGVGLLVLAALITVIAVTSSSTSSTGQLSYDQLQPGDCLTGSNLGLGSGGTWPSYVTAVPCTQQHLAEIFFVSNVWPQSLITYPGDDTISAQADARCSAAFRAYDGIDNTQSAFTFTDVQPASSTWPDGDRQLTCVAYGSTQVDYSIKGSHK